MDNVFPVKLEAVAELHAYWNDLARDGFDGRDAIADLPHISTKLMAIDVTAAGFVYRHFGADIAAYLNSDHTGRAVGSSALVEQVKLAWLGLLRGVAARRAPQLVQIDSGAGPTAYVLALPLNLTTAPTKNILVGVFYDGPVGAKVIIRNWRALSLSQI